jgi:hypothetical protein
LASLFSSYLLGIAPTFPSKEVHTKPGMVENGYRGLADPTSFSEEAIGGDE